ncbi:TIGR02680 family protein [Amycolatopsis alkalitolerans]|nr:TIGR02680 family protein [Amycolatopsis alkalitolerans]
MAVADEVAADPHRFRLSRAGVLNVWQYDEQVFELADGRMLLRGANGTGKSKTLEILLPFVLDADKRRLSATGSQQHTSLLWLMLENGSFGSSIRIGYVWVEFARIDEDGRREVFTCGVGIRASDSAKTATTWCFTSPRAVGDGLELVDAAGPLPPERCRDAVEPDGLFFDQHSVRAYREQVGHSLFGLEPERYDELLRMLYWLRRPQVGEDIDPRSLAETLSIALPQLDANLLRSTGESMDQLADFGDQIDGLARATKAVQSFAETYRRYAATVVAERAAAAHSVIAEHRKLQRAVQDREKELDDATIELGAAEDGQEDARRRRRAAEIDRKQLEGGPEARSRQRLSDAERRARELKGVAERDASRAAELGVDARRADEDVVADGVVLGGELSGIHRNATELTGGLVDLRVGATLVIPTLGDPPAALTDADRLQSTVERHATQVGECHPAIGTARAAVRAVGEALTAAERAERKRVFAEERAADAERAAEESGQRLETAEERADIAEAAFTDALHGWRSDPRAVPVELSDELDETVLHELGDRARAAARPALDALRERQSAAKVELGGAQRLLADLRDRRAAIEAERDPAPAPPPLPRTPRDPAEGDPLWRLVDFADGVDGDEAAGLEAALESAGLLDAWVRSDGAVLDTETHDVVLAVGPAAPGTTLLAALAPAPMQDSPVTAETVRAVLGRVGLGDSGGGSGALTRVGFDGSWRSGPVDGRASKPAAQYIGARARVAERARRLAAVDDQIAEADARLAAAGADLAGAEQRIAQLDAWLSAAPKTADLLNSWSRVASERTVHDRDLAELRRRAEEAERLRHEAAQARQVLTDLADRHALPADRSGLDVRDSALAALDRQLAAQEERCGRARGSLARWARDRERADAAQAKAQAAGEQAAEAAELAAEAAIEYESVRSSVGAAVQELERKLSAVRERGEQAERDLREADDAVKQWTGERGAYREQVANAKRVLAEHQPVHAATIRALGTLHAVEGLLDATLDRASGSPPPANAEGRAAIAHAAAVVESAGEGWAGPADSERDGTEAVAVLAAASEYRDGDPVPTAWQRLAKEYADLRPESPVSSTTVMGRWTELSSGDAGSADPRWFEQHDVVVVVGRDQAGEHPIGVLARRMAAKLAADRELFTEREGRIFTQHLLGDLGDALRARRREADDLVAAMNRLLSNVSTSQGIKVGLDWRLKDDAAREVKEAAELLTKPMGALLSEERQRLKDALHRLIETSREDNPELDYTAHLNAALDYRTWSEFRIRISRPDAPNDWKALTRRTPLSQGEQKVVCYLPLFAAASAHFTSVAGASASAPRFILLDDAFPKIDMKTHPKLFGLLVDFDLDFVVTSERLWGDYETVPKLAIYEALRSPTERGIAQYKHLWDGRRLHAVGQS